MCKHLYHNAINKKITINLRRGLTPPHRVKSISMATFTQEEIDFLKERGNEFCGAIWLGLMPPSVNHSHNNSSSSKDEQKMKDFMSAKYELKRYYLDPATAVQLLGHKSSKHSSSSRSSNSSSSSLSAATSTIIKAPPNKSLSSPVPLSSIVKVTTKEPEIVNSNTTVDFVADFSKVPAAPTSSPLTIPTLNNKVPRQQKPQQQQQPSVVPQPSFANFDNNPIFDSSIGKCCNNFYFYVFNFFFT